MKFLWFHFIPYPELPDDFHEAHRSVWVDVDPKLFDPDVTAAAFDSAIDLWIHADECGFDGICVNEHHNTGYGFMPSPNLIASILAHRTSRSAIIVLGNSIAMYNPPIRVAEEMAMIDLISRGRLIAGFPVGTSMDTTFGYSINPGTLRARYHEGIELILKAWQADEPFAFNGRFSQLRYVNPTPRPMQRPTPPIWVPGGGSVETWDFCAENDYVYGMLTYYGHAAARENIERYWERVEAAGRDHNPYRLALTQFIGVADTDREARELYREPAEYFFNRCVHVYSGFANPPGYMTEASIRSRYRSQVWTAARAKRVKHELTWDQMVEEGYVVVGSPDTVRETLEDACRSLNVGNLVTLLHFGNMSDDLTRYNSRLFAEKVAPGLRDLHAGSGYEHEWWPANAG